MISIAATSPMASVIDLTAEPNDHLTTLPPEILQMIIGNLFASHEPDKAFWEPSLSKVSAPTIHSFDCLAATCRTLRGEVNSWCRTFLNKHAAITNYKPFANKELQAHRNFVRGRGGLLPWTQKRCVFCGKKTARWASLMNGCRCCAVCDKREWPDKISTAEAYEKYDLREEQLLPHEYFSAQVVKLMSKHPGGLPKLRYGAVIIPFQRRTALFLRKDVEALAKLAHGDLKEHLAKRKRERTERRNQERLARKQARAT